VLIDWPLLIRWPADEVGGSFKIPPPHHPASIPVYAGVSTAVLVFTKTNSGGTDHVWFYDVQADGWSLDDKRTSLLPDEKLGPVPKTALIEDEHAKNNLPDVLVRWAERTGVERERPRTAQSFCVPT